jgi:ribonuclease HI
MGWIKLNWDVALDILAKKLGLGVVVRDSCGVFVVAKAAVIPFISDPTTGEALAAWSAITLAHDLDLQKVVLEGDSQPVIAAICSGSDHP